MTFSPNGTLWILLPPYTGVTTTVVRTFNGSVIVPSLEWGLLRGVSSVRENTGWSNVYTDLLAPGIIMGSIIFNGLEEQLPKIL